jgi:hypothetical protein
VSPTLLSRRDRWHLAAVTGFVLLNYLAQIPYELHLYGTDVNVRGALLLGGSLAWFVLGMGLLLRGSPAGYWLLVSFLAVEFAFYFHNEVMLIPVGYGMAYGLTHARDGLLWTVFLIGDLNFLAAGYFLCYLVGRRFRLIGP